MKEGGRDGNRRVRARQTRGEEVNGKIKDSIVSDSTVRRT